MNQKRHVFKHMLRDCCWVLLNAVEIPTGVIGKFRVSNFEQPNHVKRNGKLYLMPKYCKTCSIVSVHRI